MVPLFKHYFLALDFNTQSTSTIMFFFEMQ